MYHKKNVDSNQQILISFESHYERKKVQNFKILSYLCFIMQ